MCCVLFGEPGALQPAVLQAGQSRERSRVLFWGLQPSALWVHWGVRATQPSLPPPTGLLLGFKHVL